MDFSPQEKRKGVMDLKSESNRAWNLLSDIEDLMFLTCQWHPKWFTDSMQYLPKPQYFFNRTRNSILKFKISKDPEKPKNLEK